MPKKQAPAEQYADFLKAISGDVKEVDRREEEEATEAAQDRTDRDAFEQRWVHCGWAPSQDRMPLRSELDITSRNTNAQLISQMV